MMQDRPLEERAREAKNLLSVTGIGTIGKYYGKDAVILAALELLGIAERPKPERLAEYVFDLVPGQIRRILRTDKNALVLYQPSPGLYLRPFLQIQLDLEDYSVSAGMAWDEESGTLVIKKEQLEAAHDTLMGVPIYLTDPDEPVSFLKA